MNGLWIIHDSAGETAPFGVGIEKSFSGATSALLGLDLLSGSEGAELQEAEARNMMDTGWKDHGPLHLLF